MEIEKHIKNLEEYCEVDNLFEKDGDFKEFCDNHIADIKAVIQDLKTTQSDLYEANNRINDLLDIVKQKDELIDLMAQELIDQQVRSFKDNFNPFKYINKEQVKKYFEERCKNAKD